MYVKREKGFTIIEVMVSSFIVAILFLAMTGAFSSNLMSMTVSKKMTQASMFLETTMESLSAQDYDSLLTMNGNRFFDQVTAAGSNYAVDLAVFTTGIELLQIRASLVDLRNNQEMARVITHRSRR